jgi:hypothetical protein
MSSNVRGRSKRLRRQDALENKTKAIRICQLFSKLDIKIIEKDCDDDSKDTQPHTPLPETNPSLLKKYLDVYGADCQANWTSALRSSKGPRKGCNFDARSRFYDRIIPVFAKLKLQNATIFRTIRLIETVLVHPTFQPLADGLKRCDPVLVERLVHHFRWWLSDVALPCLTVACEQTEVGVNWQSRVAAACLTLDLPMDRGLLHAHTFRIYMIFGDTLYDLTYADMTVNVFNKLPMNTNDASVVRELAEKLLLQQLIFDAELSSQATNEEMIQAAALMMLERLEEYVDGLLSDNESIPEFGESLRQVRQSLLQFPRKRTCEVNSRLAHIRNNVDQINESADDEGGHLTNLKRMIYE